MKNLKETFISLASLCSARDDVSGDQLVTDRYVAWRVESLPEVVAQRLRAIPDGVWDVTSSGAYKPAGNQGTYTPLKYGQIHRLMNYDTPGLELLRTPVALSTGGPAQSRVWVSPDGTAGGLIADNLNLTGFTLRATSGGLAQRLLVQRNGENVGLIMGRKPPEGLAGRQSSEAGLALVLAAWSA